MTRHYRLAASASSWPDPDAEADLVAGPATDATRWHPTTKGDAAFLLEVKAQATQARDELERQYQELCARARVRVDQLLARQVRREAWADAELERWATANRGQLLVGKAKSVDLVTGRLGWRSKQGRLVVEDKAALVAWLEQQPLTSGLYRFKVEPDMAQLQELCRTTGEVPPGCTYQEAAETFYASPAVEALTVAPTPDEKEQP